MKTSRRILGKAVLHTALAFSALGTLYCDKPTSYNPPASQPVPARTSVPSASSLESVVERSPTKEKLKGIHTTILLGRHKTKEDAEQIASYITPKHSTLYIEGEATQDQAKMVNKLINQEIEEYRTKDARAQQEIGKRFLGPDAPLILKQPEFDLQLLSICARYNLRVHYFEYHPLDRLKKWEEEKRTSQIEISMAVYGSGYRAENLKQAKEDMLRNTTYENQALVKAVEKYMQALIEKIKERDKKINQNIHDLEDHLELDDDLLIYLGAAHSGAVEDLKGKCTIVYLTFPETELFKCIPSGKVTPTLIKSEIKRLREDWDEEYDEALEVQRKVWDEALEFHRKWLDQTK